MSCLGLQDLGSKRVLERHRHPAGYVAVALSGAYTEAGDQGRFNVEVGHAIVHTAFEAHRNELERRTVTVLNLPLAPPLFDRSGLFRCSDPDSLARLAETDIVEAGHLAAELLQPEGDGCSDWPDQLARELTRPGAFSIGSWAAEIGMSPQTVSRGFRRTYGVSPKRFRAERRASEAARSLPSWQGSIADLAAAAGFADQAHLSRSIKSLTGASPLELRSRLQAPRSAG